MTDYPALELSNLHAEPLLDGISHVFSPRSITAIVGKNGAGKSTLLNVIAGIKKPTGGRIKFHEMEIHSLLRKQVSRLISYLPQFISIASHTTVADCLVASRFPWKEVGKRLASEERRIFTEMLNHFALTDLQHRKVSSLSGGERQRVLIASVFCQDTPIILLDEPDSHLDPFQERLIFSRVTEIAQRTGKTVIIVSHNYNLAREFCSHLIAMDQGRIEWCKSADEVTEETVRKVYGF